MNNKWPVIINLQRWMFCWNMRSTYWVIFTSTWQLINYQQICLWCGFIVHKKYLCSKKEIPPHKAKTMIIEDRGVLPYWIVMTISLWNSWYIVISHTSLFFITFLAPRSFFPKIFFIKSQKISVHVNHTPDYSTLCKISAKLPNSLQQFFMGIFLLNHGGNLAPDELFVVYNEIL